MAVTIGSLGFDLRGYSDKVSGDVRKGLDGVYRDMTKKGSAFNKVTKSMAIGLAAVGTAAVGMGYLVSREISKIITVTNEETVALGQQAKVAGTTVENLQVLAKASGRFGIEQDKLSDILKDVNDKVGDFLITGAGPMVDFFEQIGPKVGVTADDFKDLSSDKALGLYVDSLEKANVSQSEMTFFMEAIASDATALIPVFRNSGEAIADAEKDLNRFGLTLTTLDVSQVEQASQEMARLRQQSGLLKQIIGVELAPVIVGISRNLLDYGDEASSAGDETRSLREDIGALIDDAAKGADVLVAIGARVKNNFEAYGLLIEKVAFEATKSVSKMVEGLEDGARGAAMVANLLTNGLIDIKVPDIGGDLLKNFQNNQEGFGEILNSRIEENLKKNEELMGIISGDEPGFFQDSVSRGRDALDSNSFENYFPGGNGGRVLGTAADGSAGVLPPLEDATSAPAYLTAADLPMFDEVTDKITDQAALWDGMAETQTDMARTRLEEIEMEQQELDRLSLMGKITDETYHRRLTALDAEMDSILRTNDLIDRQDDLLERATGEVRILADSWGIVAARTELALMRVRDSFELTDAVEDQFLAVMGNMGSAIDSFVDEGRFEIGDFVKDVLKDLLKIELKSAIIGGIFGAGANKGMESSGLLGSLLGGFGGSDSKGSGLLGGIKSIFGGFFADGGIAPAGKLSVVGERGPELIAPSTARRVIPMEDVTGGTGATAVNQYFETGVTRAELGPALDRASAKGAEMALRAIQQGGSFRDGFRAAI